MRIHQLDTNERVKFQKMSDLQILKEMDCFDEFKSVLNKIDINNYIKKYGFSPLFHFIGDHNPQYRDYVLDEYTSSEDKYWNKKLIIRQ